MAEAGQRNRRILLVDDDDGVRISIASMLANAGYDVVEAKDGLEAVDLFRRGGFDLVITDILMPKQVGVDTIVQIRKLDKGVKILAISGSGPLPHNQYLQNALDVGANAVLDKPFSIKRLVQAVARSLR